MIKKFIDCDSDSKMQSIHMRILRSVAIAAMVVIVGRAFGQSDSTSSKPTSYSPYSSLMYSPYSSMMSSMYSQYSPLMANSMVMPYYSSGYPYASYGHSSSYHPSQYMAMAASYPQSTYAPLPYMAYGLGSGYSPVSNYYG